MVQHYTEATPLVAERLLEHAGFEEVARETGGDGVEIAWWAPRRRSESAVLAKLQIPVYHYETLSQFRALQVLRVTDAARRICEALPQPRPAEGGKQ